MKIIAIDPGVNGSGVCVYENRKVTYLFTFRTWELYEFLIKYGKNDKIIVENSNLIKGNWHGKTGRGNVGKNQSVSQEIVDFCKASELDYEEIKPDGYSQVYDGALGKRMFVAETGWKKSNNKDQRAAYAMAIRWHKLNQIKSK